MYYISDFQIFFFFNLTEEFETSFVDSATQNKKTNLKKQNDCISLVNTDVSQLKDDINSILIEIINISKKLNNQEEEGDRSLDWKFAAMVLDRLCLYVFAVVTIALTCGILMSSPNFFKLTLIF